MISVSTAMNDSPGAIDVLQKNCSSWRLSQWPEKKSKMPLEKRLIASGSSFRTLTLRTRIVSKEGQLIGTLPM
jgi:hypothetical protein